jgi:hypothetical protein
VRKKERRERKRKERKRKRKEKKNGKFSRPGNFRGAK